MINSRDSYTDFSINTKESINLPYRIGTIVESKEDSSLLARICQYRVTNESSKQVIYVGLNADIFKKKSTPDVELTIEELKDYWKKSDNIIITELPDEESYLRISGFSDSFEEENRTIKL